MSSYNFTTFADDGCPIVSIRPAYYFAWLSFCIEQNIGRKMIRVNKDSLLCKLTSNADNYKLWHYKN